MNSCLVLFSTLCCLFLPERLFNIVIAVISTFFAVIVCSHQPAIKVCCPMFRPRTCFCCSQALTILLFDSQMDGEAAARTKTISKPETSSKRTTVHGNELFNHALIKEPPKAFSSNPPVLYLALFIGALCSIICIFGTLRVRSSIVTSYESGLPKNRVP